VSNEDSVPPIKDRYTTEHDDDPEAEELMRTLCAHLLPFGVDQKSELLDQIPAWDESNPDEAGYRIIRLTKDQLRRIEKAFENIVTGLKKDSERNLAEANGSDEAFERDLLAAEELLEREEKKLTATQRALTSVGKAKNGSVFGADMSDEDDCLAAFPGIRPTGKGEMGDLEYFNLPIIFSRMLQALKRARTFSWRLATLSPVNTWCRASLELLLSALPTSVSISIPRATMWTATKKFV
jgi:hypothetical protein